MVTASELGLVGTKKPVLPSAVMDSIDRVRREQQIAQKRPSTGNQIIRALAVVAAVGTLIGASLELAESFRNDE